MEPDPEPLPPSRSSGNLVSPSMLSIPDRVLRRNLPVDAPTQDGRDAAAA